MSGPKPYTVYRTEGPDGTVLYARTMGAAGLIDQHHMVALVPVDGLPTTLDYFENAVRIDGRLACTFSAPIRWPWSELTEVCPDDEWSA